MRYRPEGITSQPWARMRLQRRRLEVANHGGFVDFQRRRIASGALFWFRSWHEVLLGRGTHDTVPFFNLHPFGFDLASCTATRRAGSFVYRPAEGAGAVGWAVNDRNAVQTGGRT